VSVDTHIGRRNLSKYHVFSQDGVGVLVSLALSPYVKNIRLDVQQFLFFRSLRAEIELLNGRVLDSSGVSPFLLYPFRPPSEGA
jgi:hypothetical protein